jgi:hypothetical protein
VNGEYEDAAGQVTEIGKLLHDFRCSDPNEMLIPEKIPTCTQCLRYTKI